MARRSGDVESLALTPLGADLHRGGGRQSWTGPGGSSWTSRRSAAQVLREDLRQPVRRDGPAAARALLQLMSGDRSRSRGDPAASWARSPRRCGPRSSAARCSTGTRRSCPGRRALRCSRRAARRPRWRTGAPRPDATPCSSCRARTPGWSAAKHQRVLPQIEQAVAGEHEQHRLLLAGCAGLRASRPSAAAPRPPRRGRGARGRQVPRPRRRPPASACAAVARGGHRPAPAHRARRSVLLPIAEPYTGLVLVGLGHHRRRGRGRPW